jgi:hypothetical protein
MEIVNRDVRDGVAEHIHKAFSDTFSAVMLKRRSLVGPSRQSRDGEYWVSFEFPAAFIERLRRRAATEYTDLPESEKDECRKVAEMIRRTVLEEAAEALEMENGESWATRYLLEMADDA